MKKKLALMAVCSSLLTCTILAIIGLALGTPAQPFALFRTGDRDAVEAAHTLNLACMWAEAVVQREKGNFEASDEALLKCQAMVEYGIEKGWYLRGGPIYWHFGRGLQDEFDFKLDAISIHCPTTDILIPELRS